MSDKTDKTGFGIADIMKSAGVDAKKIRIVSTKSGSGVKDGHVALGLKMPMEEILIAAAMKNKKPLWDVLPRDARNKLKADQKKAAKEQLVSVIDWRVARLAVKNEVKRCQNALGNVNKKTTEAAMKEFGVYRKTADGDFKVPGWVDQGRKSQMISLVKRVKDMLENQGRDCYIEEHDKEGPTILL